MSPVLPEKSECWQMVRRTGKIILNTLNTQTLQNYEGRRYIPAVSLLENLQADAYSRLACDINMTEQLSSVILQQCCGKIVPLPV